MTRRPVPYDGAIETAVIGDMVALPESVAELARRLDPADFHDRRCSEAFAALVESHGRGQSLDTTGLASRLRARGIVDPQWLADALASGSGSWKAHADTLLSYRVRRDLVTAAADALSEARDLASDPEVTLTNLSGRLRTIERDAGAATPAGLWGVDEFASRPDSVASPWVVPGLVRKDWRVVIIGAEGGGKSLLFRQFAVCAAQGRHPLRPGSQIDPVSTLIVDLENPAAAITGSLRGLGKVGRAGGAHIWHRPGGIDLRGRADRRAFEAVLAAARPDLVCIGPEYKMARRARGESHEDATVDLQLILDDLRTRHGFGMLLEHHAPQEQGGQRSWRPYGSSYWLRWPELGLSMVPEPTNDKRRRVRLKRWRGDRMTNQWPAKLTQGDDVPWVAADALRQPASPNGKGRQPHLVAVP